MKHPKDSTLLQWRFLIIKRLQRTCIATNYTLHWWRLSLFCDQLLLRIQVNKLSSLSGIITIIATNISSMEFWKKNMHKLYEYPINRQWSDRRSRLDMNNEKQDLSDSIIPSVFYAIPYLTSPDILIWKVIKFEGVWQDSQGPFKEFWTLEVRARMIERAIRTMPNKQGFFFFETN